MRAPASIVDGKVWEDRNENSLLLAASAVDDTVAEGRNNQKHLTLWDEAKSFLVLAAMTMVVELGMILPVTVSCAFVGRELGVVPLDGLVLSDVVINLTVLSLLQGLAMPSETLSPQAYGSGNYAELGVLAVRSFVVSMAFVVPVAAITAIFLKRLLVSIGEDAAVSALAASWYGWNLLAIPFTAAIFSIMPFFTTQEQMTPLVAAILVSGLLILPCSLYFLVSILGLGYLGSCIANVVTAVSTTVVLFAFVRYVRPQPYEQETWPGIRVAIRETFKQTDSLVQYVKMGMGGILASTEIWYWEVLVGLVGTFGVVPLSAHGIASEVVFTVYMISLGIGEAITTRMGVTLSAGDLPRTRWIVMGGVGFGIVVGVVISLGIYYFRGPLFSLFTTDAEVIELCHRIWGDVSLYFLQVTIFTQLEAILLALGHQWTLGIITTITLWCVSLPLVYYLTVIRESEGRGSVELLWRTLNPPYFVMNVILAIHAFVLSDWNANEEERLEREKEEDESSETEE